MLQLVLTLRSVGEYTWARQFHSPWPIVPENSVYFDFKHPEICTHVETVTYEIVTGHLEPIVS